MTVIASRGSRTKDQPSKEKICQFPGCGDKFMGRGKTKYCDEHRLAKYRSRLYGIPKDLTPVYDHNGTQVKVSDLNKTIKHSECIASLVELQCECCQRPYNVTILPSQFIYPKYCEEHRNEYKRNLYNSRNSHNA